MVKRSGFLSMFAAIGYPKKVIKPQVDGSYLAMATTVGSVSQSPQADQQELFRRMVFNAMVGNDDDHLRNHGFNWTPRGWRLSPLFDVVPRPFRDIEDRRLNQGFGDQGNLCTVENFLSRSEVFALSRQEAQHLLNEMVASIRTHWMRIFKDSGVPDDDMEGFRATFSIVQVFSRS